MKDIFFYFKKSIKNKEDIIKGMFFGQLSSFVFPSHKKIVFLCPIKLAYKQF